MLMMLQVYAGDAVDICYLLLPVSFKKKEEIDRKMKDGIISRWENDLNKVKLEFKQR